MKTPLFPIFLNLEDRPVLVVGGGNVATRRVPRLLEANARLTVVSPALTPPLASLRDEGRFQWLPRRFRASDLEQLEVDGGKLDDFDLVCVAVPPAEAAPIRAAFEARFGRSRRPTWVNWADSAASSDFHFPAVARRGDVQVAVSTGGRNPRGAARLRNQLEPRLGAGTAVADADGTPGGTRSGRVILVGAGPGDPELLTLRAQALLESADVVFYDRLVSQAILETIPEDVESVYVGKEVGRATRANICELLITAARAGKRVVRLKGGDPFVFGRGGEEILTLRQAGVDVQVVPGISALSAVPGSAGIPLTHRGLASQVIVRSGHRLPKGTGPTGSAPLPTSDETTYVYFMAARRIAEAANELQNEGVSADTPAALVQHGTLPQQAVLKGRLGGLAAEATRQNVEAPALLVVGKTVEFDRETGTRAEGQENVKP